MTPAAAATVFVIDDDAGMRASIQDLLKSAASWVSRTGQVLRVIRKLRKPDQWNSAGVNTAIDRYVEAQEEVWVRSFEPGESCVGARRTVDL
jgi:hypothetical protein